MLIGKGCEILIHDRDVSKANIIGANREYVEREIPHLWSLMRREVSEVVATSDTIVIGNASSEYRGLGPELNGRHVVDLARALEGRRSGDRYHGICW